MNRQQTHRLLKLIGLFQAGKGYNADALAQECGVSRRTIFRDVETLRAAGLDLRFDESRQGYRVPTPHYLPPTNFTADEALAMLVICHELGDRVGMPLMSPARSAAIKLESSLPQELRDAVQKIVGFVNIRQAPSNPLDGQATIYQQLLSSIGEGTRVRIFYRSLTPREDISTRLSPYRLLFSQRSWYVIGRSSIHRHTRTFNLSRIVRLEMLPDKFQVPRGFSIQRYLGNAWHMIPEPGPDIEILIRFTPMVAENVAEVAWHRTQRVSFNADGSLDFRATVSGLKEVSWWIMGYADQAKVISPESLQALIAGRAAKIATLYAPVQDLDP